MELPAKAEILIFQKVILKWYKSNGRTFPWRKKRLSAYHKIIAEVLLQRTKAGTVSKFYGNFFKKYSSWKELSKMHQLRNFKHS